MRKNRDLTRVTKFETGDDSETIYLGFSNEKFCYMAVDPRNRIMEECG